MISDRSQNVLRFLLLLLFFYKTYHWLSQDTVIFEKKKVVQDFGFFIKCLIFLYLSLSLSISLYLYLSLSLSQKKLYNVIPVTFTVHTTLYLLYNIKFTVHKTSQSLYTDITFTVQKTTFTVYRHYIY